MSKPSNEFYPYSRHTAQEVAAMRKGPRGKFQFGRRTMRTAIRRITTGDLDADPTGENYLTEAELADYKRVKGEQTPLERFFLPEKRKPK